MLDCRRPTFMIGASLVCWTALACLAAAPNPEPLRSQGGTGSAHWSRVAVDFAPLASAQQRKLSQPQPWRGGVVPKPSFEVDRAGDRARSLERRATYRAFEGAPPTMPHSAVYGAGQKECLDCHTSGIQIGERLGRPTPHEALTSCLQCHVEAASSDFPAPAMVENGFVGSRGSAARAGVLPGAPPPMPHTLQMRTQCLSCHGEFGYPGLRTTHPERALCAQCHVDGSARR